MAGSGGSDQRGRLRLHLMRKASAILCSHNYVAGGCWDDRLGDTEQGERELLSRGSPLSLPPSEATTWQAGSIFSCSHWAARKAEVVQAGGLSGPWPPSMASFLLQRKVLHERP
eukprot:1158605-Pelagomonas_calceolata.AAC.15